MKQPYAALLRGVNVGGERKIPMADLRLLAASLGHEDVATYVQSGNIVFTASGPAAGIAEGIEQGVRAQFGFDCAVQVRTGRELAAIAGGNPFGDVQADASKLQVTFLDRKPAKARVAVLDPDRSPPDEFEVRGREIYSHCPKGFGRSKLTIDYFEGKLDVRATARNWKTVTALAEMTSR